MHAFRRRGATTPTYCADAQTVPHQILFRKASRRVSPNDRANIGRTDLAATAPAAVTGGAPIQRVKLLNLWNDRDAQMGLSSARSGS